jgi:transcriptional regulator GlxA family with amidase domain
MAHTKIVFLILPHVHLIDFAGPMQVFYEAQDFGADISLEYCSPDGDISTSTQFPLGKLKSFREINLSAGDHLFVPGSQVDYLVSKKLSNEKELINWVKRAHADGVYICSVCTGAFFLALNGRKCTTHWKRTAELKQRYPAVHLTEDILFTEDERLYTSAGVTTGVDLALHILSKLTDENISYKVAREMVVYLRRSGSESQQSIFMKYRSHIHSGIHKLTGEHDHQNFTSPTC